MDSFEVTLKGYYDLRLELSEEQAKTFLEMISNPIPVEQDESVVAAEIRETITKGLREALYPTGPAHK